jgi:hypothetical protein
LVERFVRDEEAAGSNPASPTIFLLWKTKSRRELKVTVTFVRGGE